MPPTVALLNYISCSILWRIFCQTGTFRGVFSTYHWYRRIHPHTVIFCGFFLIIVRRKDQRSCDVRGGSTYQSVCPIVGIGSPPHPLIRMWVCLPPWIQRGGATLFCSWGGGGTHCGRLDRRPAWHSVYSLASVVELKEKGPSRRRPELGRLFLFLEYEEKAAKLRWVGARSALFGVAMSPKWQVRAAHGRARAAKTH